jgi:hypothetical protein
MVEPLLEKQKVNEKTAQGKIIKLQKKKNQTTSLKLLLRQKLVPLGYTSNLIRCRRISNTHKS